MTDRQTEFSSLDRVCIPCSAVMSTSESWGINRHTTFSIFFYKHLCSCSRRLYLADDRNNRVGTGKSLKMFVARVLLGRTFLGRQPQQFRKPPCTSCYSDSCTVRNHHNSFDSVVATHKGAGGTTRLLFREFVVYDLTQSYPEFLVKYERRYKPKGK